MQPWQRAGSCTVCAVVDRITLLLSPSPLMCLLPPVRRLTDPCTLPHARDTARLLHVLICTLPTPRLLLINKWHAQRILVTPAAIPVW